MIMTLTFESVVRVLIALDGPGNEGVAGDDGVAGDVRPYDGRVAGVVLDWQGNEGINKITAHTYICECMGNQVSISI